MKVAYLTYARPEDRRAWSGTSYYMRRALEMAGLDVEVIGSMLFPPSFWPERFVHLVAERTGHARKHIWTFEPRVIKLHTKSIEMRLAMMKPDVIVSSGSMLVSHLKTSVPIYFWSDATFAAMVDYYFLRDKITEATFTNGERLERLSISKAAGVLYSSAWAAESAVRDYGKDPKQVHVVPFGANLENVPSAEEAAKLIDQRPQSPVRLLFLGVEWHRKGGDYAIAVAEELTKRGVKCELKLVGCQVPREIVLPPYIEEVGFINKQDPEQRARMKRMIEEAHFLILPSRADCTPIVFSELNAQGVPILTTNTGGIPSVVTHGVNGFCATLGDDVAHQLATLVIDTMSDLGRYRALGRSSYQTYVEKLNWKVNGLKVRGILEHNHA